VSWSRTSICTLTLLQLGRLHPILTSSPSSLSSERPQSALTESISFLQTDVAPPRQSPTVHALAVRVQNSALDALQILVNQRDMSMTLLESLKTALLRKLDSAIRHSHLTLQRKMLILLHATMSTSDEALQRVHKRTSSVSEKSLPNGRMDSPDLSKDLDRTLVRIIIDSLSSSTNRPVFVYWIHLVLDTTPRLLRQKKLLNSLCYGLCKLLQDIMVQLLHSYDQTASKPTTTDIEPNLLLAALERIMTSLAPVGSLRRSQEGTPRPNDGGSGIFGLMSGVFAVEAPASADTVSCVIISALTQQSKANLDCVNDAVEALLVTWAVTVESPSRGSSGPTKTRTFLRIRRKAREVLEKLFDGWPSAVLGSCIHVWATSPKDVPVGPG